VIFGYFITHIVYVVVLLIRQPSLAEAKAILFGPNSMVPRRKDLEDVVQQFKWYLGLGERPQFDRFSYMEKFDYWAVFWGVAIIGGSGLLLWAPEFFARFLPGWVFNIATIRVHLHHPLLQRSPTPGEVPDRRGDLYRSSHGRVHEGGASLRVPAA
jgi:cytochrome b subunit of formate dehydrogenase